MRKWIVVGAKTVNFGWVMRQMSGCLPKLLEMSDREGSPPPLKVVLLAQVLTKQRRGKVKR